MIRFEEPLALLLALPTALLLWRWGRAPGRVLLLRACTAAALLLAWSSPSVRTPGAGADAVVAVDLSRSMPPDAGGSAQALVRTLEKQRGRGDRVGVVVFAREAMVESAPQGEGRFAGFTQGVDPDGSDLAAALDLAGELVGPGRAGRLLLVSDGRSTGPDPSAAARRLAARGIAIDYEWIGRGDPALDLAVVSVDPPGTAGTQEPFRFTATVHTTAAVRARVILERNRKPLLESTVELQAGHNVLQLADLVEVPGVAAYDLRVEAPGDTVAENDVGRGLTRVEGPPRVLVLSPARRPSAVTEVLEAAGLPVETRRPFPPTMEALEGVGAVVLENVPAQGLGETGLAVLAQFVRDAGGGLVMTGGRESFGEGGYHRSALDRVLPVSLELREEQRTSALAMVLVLDRSGSMAMTVRDGRQKMALAAEGVVAALDMLSPRDEVALHVVDSAVHPIFHMRPAGAGLPRAEVLSLRSEGGGIFVGAALRAARDEVMASRNPTRHLVLFSDAADSEEPDDYRQTLADLRTKEVTVSVIGLGAPTDRDGALLEEIARLGGGRMHFVEDAMSLPRIFSQETIAVARSSFVRRPTPVARAGDSAALGLSPSGGLPTLGGYNVTYARPEAGMALRTADDKGAPVLAFWQHGAGRAVAFTAEADGPSTGELRDWGGYRAALEQMVRWTLRRRPAGGIDAVARAHREGHLLRTTLDLAPGDVPAGATARLVVLSGDAREPPVELPLSWEDDGRLGSSWPLPRSGTYHPVFTVGGEVLRAPPVALSYSVEMEPGRAAAGRELLARLARLSGGRERHGARGFFDEASAAVGTLRLRLPLLAAALALFFLEIVARRTWPGRRAVEPRVEAGGRGAAPGPGTAEPQASPASGAAAGRAEAPEPGEPAAPASEGEPGSGSRGADLEAALRKARDRARQRLGK